MPLHLRSASKHLRLFLRLTARCKTLVLLECELLLEAFALGYQHFNLPAKTTDQEIRLQAQLPGGRYTVRADAIGEIPARQRIYRAAREAGPFQVPAQ